MESIESNDRRTSDPYEWLRDWAKQLTNKGDKEPRRQSREYNGRSRLSIGDDRLLDTGNDHLIDTRDDDSIEEIIDIYLNIQHENEGNAYKDLEKLATRFDQNKEERVEGVPATQEEGPVVSRARGTDERAKEAAHPIDSHGDNPHVNRDEQHRRNEENANDQKKDKQTECKQKSVMSGLLRTLFNSPALCECEQETASVVGSGRTQPESTGRSFSDTSATGSSNNHDNSKANAPLSIPDRYRQ